MKCMRELLDIDVYGTDCMVVSDMECVRELLDIHGTDCIVVCVMKCMRELLVGYT